MSRWLIGLRKKLVSQGVIKMKYKTVGILACVLVIVIGTISIACSEVTETLYPPWDTLSWHDEWAEFGGGHDYTIDLGTHCNFGYAYAKSIYFGKAYQDVRLFHVSDYIAPRSGYYSFHFKETYNGSFDAVFLIVPPSVASIYDKIQMIFKVEWDGHIEKNTVILDEATRSDDIHLTLNDTETYSINDVYITANTNVRLSTDIYLYVYAEAFGLSRADGWINFLGCLDKIMIDVPSEEPEPPSVTTKDADPVKATYATLNGYLDDLGGASSCKVWFKWGKTQSYGNTTGHITMDSPGKFSKKITGLSRHTEYHFKAVAENSAGKGYGYDKSFTTRWSNTASCFLAGTQIAMADGSYKNIENIKVGDLVKCYDFKKARRSYARVTKVQRHGEKEMADYYLVINKTLRVTTNHHLYINDKWTEAGKAKPGDRLLSVHGSIIIIKSVEKVFERVPTYNIEVAGYQNFFASEVLAAQKFALSEEILSDPGFMKDKPIGLGDNRVPESFALSQNYPNPFNPETTIRFDLSEPCPVNLRIYNVRGQLVRELVDGYREHGSHEVLWDGRNSQGHLVPSGIYFCRMRAGDFAYTMKMALIK